MNEGGFDAFSESPSLPFAPDLKGYRSFVFCVLPQSSVALICLRAPLRAIAQARARIAFLTNVPAQSASALRTVCSEVG